MYLVDDEDLVASELRWDARLLHERLDMFHTVVGGCVELEDVQRTLLIERLTTLAFVAGLALCRWILTVDGFGENSGTSCLAYTPWTAEEVGMGQFTALHGILQGRGECRLSYDGIEGNRTVLTC